jgi:hypothetical protein
MRKIVPILFFVVVSIPAFAQIPELAKADSMAGLFPHHSLADLKVLSNKLTGPLTTDEGKFRAIFKWVCLNIENDFDAADQNLKKRRTLKDEELKQWTREFSGRTMRILFQQYKTVCTGYAYLVRELARHAGLPCEIVDGYGRNVNSNIGGQGFVNHSWNAVLLNGRWYLADPTWASGAVFAPTRTFIPRFEECYFLADPVLFVRNHYPLNTTWTLLSEPPSLETFLNAPLIYVNAFRYNVHPVLPATFRITATKGEKVSFMLGKSCVVNPANVKFLVGNGVSHTKVPYVESGYSVSHTFSRKGVYAVHFTVDDQYVASYEVTIK